MQNCRFGIISSQDEVAIRANLQKSMKSSTVSWLSSISTSSKTPPAEAQGNYMCRLICSAACFLAICPILSASWPVDSWQWKWRSVSELVSLPNPTIHFTNYIFMSIVSHETTTFVHLYGYHHLSLPWLYDSVDSVLTLSITFFPPYPQNLESLLLLCHQCASWPQ